MRVLVTGAAGLLAAAIVREFEGAGWSVVALDRAALDVTSADQVRRTLGGTRADLVINCAAFNDAADDGRDSAAPIGNIAAMQSSGREPSMEDILASIKKVIAEEKELRSSGTVALQADEEASAEVTAIDEDDVLELDEPLAPPADLGPPLLDDNVAGHSREALEQLSTIAASVPAVPAVNPLEDMVREMLRPMLKQWLDDHLPQMVDEHVKREISRITGRPL